MARALRIEYQGALYHITSRGNAKREIFLDAEDYSSFLDTLGEVISRHHWLCHAYCLMPNHYHLLIETPDANLSRGMHLLNCVFSQRFNRRHRRVGHLLQGRYKAILVEKESYLLELARYIVLNPVRAGHVRAARHWPWSSYRATTGAIDPPQFLTTDWLLSQFATTRSAAVSAYRRFVSQGVEGDVWANVKGGCLLGSEAFVNRMQPLLRDAPMDPNVLRRERDAARPSLTELFARIPDSVARDEAIHEAINLWHYRLLEVAERLGLHFTTISVIASRERTARGIQE